MAEITWCESCGERTPQIWGRKEKCPSCNGPLIRKEVQVPLDRVPKILNILGIVSMVIVVASFIYFVAGPGVSGSARMVLMVLLIISIIMYASSLITQYMVERTAWAQHKERAESRKTRKVRHREGMRPTMVSGSIDRKKQGAGRATKLPIKK